MNKKIILLFSLLFCFLFLNITIISAQSTNPEIIETDLNGIKQLIRDELSGQDYQDLLLIKGTNLYIQEEFLMILAQQQLPDLVRIQKELDIEITNITETASHYQKLIFLGGETTNKIVHDLKQNDSLQIDERYASAPFLISIGSLNSSTSDVLIFSTSLESTMLENNGPKRSPLSQVLDKRLIPIVATVATITLLHIFNLFSSTISEFLFDFTSEKVGERKKKKHRFERRQKTSKTAQYAKETISILIAIIVLSLSLSWTWSANLSHFYSLFMINIFVVSLFYLLREGLRLHYSRKYNLNTEHVFWPLGSILTFFSTLLGNTFSLASYIALENEEKEKRYSKMYFTIFIILFSLTLLTYILNIYFASQILQMFYVFTIMAVFIDMTPIEPMDGYEVKKHNVKKWVALYIPVFIVYIIIMFSTLI
jgi:hypothetical protein